MPWQASRQQDGWQYKHVPRAPATAREEYFKATGIRLAHNFAGPSLTDTVGGVVLAPTGSPAFNVEVSNLLDGFPLASDPASHLQTRAYNFPGTGDKYKASPGAVAIGAESVMISITTRFGAQVSNGDLVGNRDSAPGDGLELKWENTGKLQLTAQAAGQAATTIDRVIAANSGLWFTFVMIADRAAGKLKLGGVSFEDVVNLSAGSLASTEGLAIGKGRNIATVATTMAVRVAFGTQVENRSASQLARAEAPLIWIAPGFQRVSTGPK